jgi:hypothetical protein
VILVLVSYAHQTKAETYEEKVSYIVNVISNDDPAGPVYVRVEMRIEHETYVVVLCSATCSSVNLGMVNVETEALRGEEVVYIPCVLLTRAGRLPNDCYRDPSKVRWTARKLISAKVGGSWEAKGINHHYPLVSTFATSQPRLLEEFYGIVT